MNLSDEEELIVAVDRVWSDNQGVGIQGWAITRKQAIVELKISTGGGQVNITDWHRRVDVEAAYPQFAGASRCGFMTYIARTAEPEITFEATVGGHSHKQVLTARGSQLTPVEPPYENGGRLFDDFIATVNANHLSVLEIGSRIVSPGSVSKRPLFPGASSYTGFDFHADGNTDIVGDAHKLSSYLDGKRFDAVFSISVFEHLAMPWVWPWRSTRR